MPNRVDDLDPPGEATTLFPEELEYRGRGRPRLPEGQRRREKLIVALNAEEMRQVMHAAADAEGGPLRVQDWARVLLLRAARKPPAGG